MRRRPMMSVVDRANAVLLTPALLDQTRRMLAALPAGQRDDFTARGWAMLCLLEEERPDIAEPGAQATALMALHFRIEALERLCARPEYRVWIRKSGQPGTSGLVHEALLETATIAPLVACDGYAAFEPAPFFRMVLRRCEAEGRA